MNIFGINRYNTIRNSSSCSSVAADIGVATIVILTKALAISVLPPVAVVGTGTQALLLRRRLELLKVLQKVLLC